MSTEADISPDTTSDTDPSTDPSTDTDTGTGADTGAGTADSSTDPIDPASDSGTDTSPDAGDTGSDTSGDVPDDAGEPDPGSDQGSDSSTDTSTDTSTETADDTAPQADTSTPADTTTASSPDAGASTDLSARRSKIVDELLPGVVPSSYGDQRFTALTFGLRKDSPGVTPGYTTCGSLPMYIARKLGDQAITGTFGVRTAGFKKGAWVEAGGDKRPKPGDLYALLVAGSTDRAGGGIAHVGVIVDASTDEWKTADAGQGDGWSAAYVTRQYDAAAGTLSGEIVGTTGPRPARVLAGWVDVDAYPFP